MVKLRESHNVNLAHFQFESWLSAMNFEQSRREKVCFAYRYVEGKCDEDDSKHIVRGIQMIEILTPLAMDDESIIAAFLFSFFNENRISDESIVDKFGTAILSLLKGVKLLDNLYRLSGGQRQIEAARRMLLSMVEDVRTVVIKLAERILFLRDRDNSEEVRVLAARECEKIYAPLANHLGIGQLKWEMEDYIFRILHPHHYFFIAKGKVREKRLDRERYLNNFIAQLEPLLRREMSDFTIYGRVKHIFSIYKKMQRKQCDFEQLSDIRAVRIITKNVEDCYRALDVVHSRFPYIKEEFDDYISNPKPNGYQSVHTVVKGDEDKIIEVQIRTWQMHEDAELGVAAHWKYKEGKQNRGQDYQDKINWLRQLLDWQTSLNDESSHHAVFDDRIYVFTPQGEIMDLPQKSTPLDFAYAIHSEIGNRCVGAKVAGKIVPFTYQLKTGDQVEIITQKNAEPSRDWLKSAGFLNTSRARSKVITFFKKQDRDKNIPLGKHLFESELAKIELSLKEVEAASLKRYNLKSLDDLFSAIGAGDIKILPLINYLQTKFIKHSAEVSDELMLKNLNKKEQKSSVPHDAIIVDGVGNLMYSLARCCEPIAGDAIAGYITQGRGISIHKSDCEQFFELKSASPERIITAEWGDKISPSHLHLMISATDRAGLLKDIVSVMANEKVKVLGIDSRNDHKEQLVIYRIKVELSDGTSLAKLLQRLVAIESVLKADRQSLER